MTERFTPSFAETFPTPMTPGILYISTEYSTCGHLCACGCGTEVITPLSPAQWALTYYDGKDVSLWPSIGNWDLPCRAHYYIERGDVVWAKAYSEAQVVRNRMRDRAALARMDRQQLGAADSATTITYPGSSDLGLQRRRRWSRFRRVLRGRS